MRLLQRRGLLQEEAQPHDPALDDSALLELAAASVQGRVASGPRAGQRVLRLGDRIDAVERQRVEVDVQVERVAEALHEGDRAAAAVHDSEVLARATAQGPEDRAHVKREDGAAQAGVIRHPQAQRPGQREHPLANGDLGQEAVDEVRSRVGHAASDARRAAAAALAREGHEPVDAALRAAHPHEAEREQAALEVRAQLAHDEARDAAATLLRSREEGLEVLPNRAVERRVLGAAAGERETVTGACDAAPLDVHARRGCEGGAGVRMRDPHFGARDENGTRGRPEPAFTSPG